MLGWGTLRYRGGMKEGGMGGMGGGRLHVAPAWRRHRSRRSLSYAGAICHPREHLQTQGALVTQC